MWSWTALSRLSVSDLFGESDEDSSDWELKQPDPGLSFTVARGQVGGWDVVVNRTVVSDSITVTAYGSVGADCVKYKGEFTKDKLLAGGFHPRVSFDDNVATVCTAVRGRKSLVISKKVDGDILTLSIRQLLLHLKMEFTLKLKKTILTEEDLRRELAKVRAENAVRDNRLEALTKEYKDQIKLKDATIKKLAQSIEQKREIIAELEERKDLTAPTQFTFDGGLKAGKTQPTYFILNGSHKTAVKKNSYGWRQIVMYPPMDASTGTPHVVRMRINRVNDVLVVGLTNDAKKEVEMGCAFYSNGTVRIRGKKKTKLRFKRKHEPGDLWRIFLDLDKCQVSFKATHCSEQFYSWTPETTPVYCGFYALKAENSVTIL